MRAFEFISQEQEAYEAGAYRKAAGLDYRNPWHPEYQKVKHNAYKRGYSEAEYDPRLSRADPMNDDFSALAHQIRESVCDSSGCVDYLIVMELLEAAIENQCLLESAEPDLLAFIQGLHEKLHSSDAKPNDKFYVKSVMIVKDRLVVFDDPPGPKTLTNISTEPDGIVYVFEDGSSWPNKRMTDRSSMFTFLFDSKEKFDYFRSAIYLKTNKFISEASVAWRRGKGAPKQQFRCTSGPRAGRVVSSLRQCGEHPNPAKAAAMKVTRAKTKVKQARKAKRTKRVNPMSKIISRLNKARKK
jgi:hypothetical protein